MTPEGQVCHLTAAALRRPSQLCLRTAWRFPTPESFSPVRVVTSHSCFSPPPAGRSQLSLRLQKGGVTSSKAGVPTRKQLDAQLDEYMSMSRSRLDRELDEYMSLSKRRLDAQLDDYMSTAGQSHLHWD